MALLDIGDIRESINNFDQAIDLSDENKLTDEKKVNIIITKDLHYII